MRYVLFDSIKDGGEMTARELLYTERRMYHEDSDTYADYSALVISEELDEAVRFVEKWVREHPEQE